MEWSIDRVYCKLGNFVDVAKVVVVGKTKLVEITQIESSSLKLKYIVRSQSVIGVFVTDNLASTIKIEVSLL